MANNVLESDEQSDLPAPKRRWPIRILKAMGLVVLVLTLAAMTGWSALVIYYSGLHGGNPRGVRAVIFVTATIAAFLFIKPRRYGVLASFVLFVSVLTYFYSLKPSNDYEWASDVAAIPSAEIDGNLLIVHNIRNFDYRTEKDFTPRWDKRTYDLAKLRTLDFMLAHWGSPAIAHAMVSFGFEGDEYLAISIEARREKSESYSAIQGFFRQFELIYIFADERDVVRLRTNYRNEDVYVYRSTVSPAQAKDLLLSYVAQANALNREPQFYNALTSNCATNILENARSGELPTRMSWKILVSGYAAEQLYGNHRIDTSMPYAQLRKMSLVNDAAKRADRDSAFSKTIRAGLPKPAQEGRAVESAPHVASTRPS